MRGMISIFCMCSVPTAGVICSSMWGEKSITFVSRMSSPTLSYLASSLHHRVPAIELVLWDEPGGYRLRFKQFNEQHHWYAVQLASFPEGPPEPSQCTETVLVAFNIKADHFVKLIYSQLEKTAKLCEDKSYRKHRDFSYMEFNHLRQQLSD